ncbi:MAG: hypothetical protein WBI82_01855 [Sphaerochaeta sp.]
MAANDMRIDVNFVDHPKVKRLIRTAGYEAFYCLMRLFSSVAKSYPKGVLTGCNQDDIESLADWRGENGVLFSALTDPDFLFLERIGEHWQIHEWDIHQPWVFNSKERSEIARQNVNKRWDKPQESYEPNTNGNTEGIQTVIQNRYESLTQNTPSPSPSPSPSPIPSHRNISITQQKSVYAQQRFNDFWEAYPRKQAKGKAEKLWKLIDMDDTLFQTIMDAIEKQKGSDDWKDEDGRYIPYPSTWLERKGWEDEVKARRPKNSGIIKRFGTEPDGQGVEYYNHEGSNDLSPSASAGYRNRRTTKRFSTESGSLAVSPDDYGII